MINRVPHFAQADLEMRTFSPVVFDEARQNILGLAGRGNIASMDGYACKISVKQGDQTAPWPPNPGSETLYALWRDTGKQLGLAVVPEERGGLSDGNLIWDSIPTLDGLGPTGDNAHCSEHSQDGDKEQEYVQISSFVTKATLNTLALIELLKPSGKSDD